MSDINQQCDTNSPETLLTFSRMYQHELLSQICLAIHVLFF